MLSGKYNTGMNAQEMARLLGRRGGRARARTLPADERRRIAALGGHARRRSLEAAQRVMINLRYAAMMLELRGGPPDVIRMKSFAGPLPGIYRQRS
jgi:hypothetical protein